MRSRRDVLCGMQAGNKPQAAAPLDSGPRAAAAAVTTAASAQQPLVSWEQRQLTREREGSEESKLLDAGEGSSSQGHLAVPVGPGYQRF